MPYFLVLAQSSDITGKPLFKASCLLFSILYGFTIRILMILLLNSIFHILFSIIMQEVTETEVPASRLHSGSRNGNGHLHHYDDDTEQLSDDIQSLHRQPKNPEYSESVTVSRIPAHQEYREGMRYDIENPRRYRDAVQIVPGQTNPGRYYSTFTQCYINSSYRRRRYRETVYIRLNAPNPKQYSTKVFVFPQSVRETFVSEVDHHDEETIKWYKVGVKMEARDYVSVKFMQVN